MIRQFFDNSGGVISLPRLREAHPERGLIYCLRFIFFSLFLMISVRPIISTATAWTDLHRICRAGRTTALDEDLKLVSRSPKRRCHGNQFVGQIHAQSIELSSPAIR